VTVSMPAGDWESLALEVEGSGYHSTKEGDGMAAYRPDCGVCRGLRAIRVAIGEEAPDA
jgi:hypothetical protein